MKRSARIGSEQINFILQITFTKPITELYVHSQVFFKYQTFKKFPVDLWEDVCGWFNGTRKSHIMDRTIKPVLKYVKYDWPLKCPLREGNFSMNYYNISISEQFAFPLVPSGHYLLDTKFTEGDRKTTILKSQTYITISDNRIEQY